ncbi:MAG: hypothetical protein CMJ34_10265 [Phycisphaerae bacterium]|nr:hypothetical protein [Phycisphaerae bacterium]
MGGTNNGMDPESIALVFMFVIMGVTILMVAGIGAVVFWLFSRAAAVIPLEQRRIGPGAIWGLYGAWMLAAIGVMSYGIITSDPEGGAESGGFLPFVQMIADLVFIASTAWIMTGLPAGFAAAFSSYSPERVPAGGHGRVLGVWLIIIAVATGVTNLVGNLVFDMGNPFDQMQDSMEMQQGAGSPLGVATGQLIMGCGQSILGIVSMVLLIVFIVTITRSRGALLKLRHEDENPAPSTPPAAPPAV